MLLKYLKVLKLSDKIWIRCANFLLYVGMRIYFSHTIMHGDRDPFAYVWQVLLSNIVKDAGTSYRVWEFIFPYL